jgi:hypothetical protein
MFPVITVSEFSDVEVFHTIPPSEWIALCGETDACGKYKPGLIANFLLEKDSISPAELTKRITEAAPTPKKRLRPRNPRDNLSDED